MTVIAQTKPRVSTRQSTRAKTEPKGIKISLVEVKTEEVKTEEVKTEEAKTEEVKTEEVKTETKQSKFAEYIVEALKYRLASADIIQVNMVQLITGLSQASKKDICTSLDLRYIFSQEIKGNDISSIARWLREFTPIIVQFNSDTGRFEGISLSQASLRIAKENNTSPWQLTKLADTPWDTFKPVPRKKVSDPSLLRVFQSLVREIARKVDTDPASNVTLLLSEFNRMVSNDFTTEFGKVRESVKHMEYITRWTEHQRKIARDAKPESK